MLFRNVILGGNDFYMHTFHMCTIQNKTWVLSFQSIDFTRFYNNRPWPQYKVYAAEPMQTISYNNAKSNTLKSEQLYRKM